MTKRMDPHSTQLVDKLWNYCNLLRDDGLSYGDYVEQLTYLLFLKMAHERTQPPCERGVAHPGGLRLAVAAGARTAPSSRPTTRCCSHELGKEPGLLGLIFRKAQNRIQDPAKLKRLIVDLIDARDLDRRRRRRQGRRLRGPAGEERRRHQVRRRPVLHAARPDHRRWSTACSRSPGETIADPACGTGGFLLAAHDYIVEQPRPRPRREEVPPRPGLPRQRDRRQHRAPVRDEPLPARHRLAATRPPRRRSTSATRCSTEPAEQGRPGPDQPAVRQEVLGDRSSALTARRRKETQTHHPPRLLGHDLEQAAQLRPAHPLDAEDRRPGRRRPARQRALRGRRRRDDPRAPARRSATSTRCCACRPASSTPRASRPTSSSSSARPAHASPRPRSCGSTTSAPTSTSR